MIIFKYSISQEGTLSITDFSIDSKSRKNDKNEQALEKLNNAITDAKLCFNPDLAGDDYEIRVILHLPKHFSEFDQSQGDLFYNKHYQFGQEHFIGKRTIFPILHFCRDHFADRNEVSFRYSNVVDSSIWNYFIQYEKGEAFCFNDKNKKLLKNAIERISLNIKHGLYRLSVTREYAEFNARKTRESYLKSFKEGGGHSRLVSPFVFHSESKIEELIEQEFNTPGGIIDAISKKKWRILLVDDKANTAMRPFKKTHDKDYLDTKLKIITNRIELILKKTKLQTKEAGVDISTDKPINADILIEWAENTDKATKALKQREYDIVLLDYLLEDGKYGYDLLKDIKESVKNEEKEYLIGPRGCYFFMFISAYPSAVHERLLAEGLNQRERYWSINVGACPTNTPQLFLYNLLKFMHRRLERLGINRLSPEEIVKQIDKIFKPPIGKTVREMADDKYHDVLSLQYHYRRMLDDVDIPKKGDNLYNIKKSVLVTDFIQQNDWLGGVLEHLSHLVYLVAFGTARQWPEMWEEYLYIRPYLAQIESPSEKERKEGIKNKNVSKWIEFYISKLKQQQR